jgi:hypothetical protein
MPTQNAVPGSASQSSQSSVTQAQPSSPPGRQHSDADATDSSSSGMPEVRILDLLILLSLVLSTLAVVWFLFAPESRALVERLVGTQK